MQQVEFEQHKICNSRKKKSLIRTHELRVSSEFSMRLSLKYTITVDNKKQQLPDLKLGKASTVFTA